MFTNLSQRVAASVIISVRFQVTKIPLQFIPRYFFPAVRALYQKNAFPNRWINRKIHQVPRWRETFTTAEFTIRVGRDCDLLACEDLAISLVVGASWTVSTLRTCRAGEPGCSSLKPGRQLALRAVLDHVVIVASSSSSSSASSRARTSEKVITCHSLE